MVSKQHFLPRAKCSIVLHNSFHHLPNHTSHYHLFTLFLFFPNTQKTEESDEEDVNIEYVEDLDEEDEEDVEQDMEGKFILSWKYCFRSYQLNLFMLIFIHNLFDYCKCRFGDECLG
jgi:hypothetical protein